MNNRHSDLGPDGDELAILTHGLTLKAPRLPDLDEIDEPTDEELECLASWLTDRLDGMLPDEETINEEEPHLLPALHKLLTALEAELKDRGLTK